MCVVVGSIDQATSTCRMCKAFKPQSGRYALRPHLVNVQTGLLTLPQGVPTKVRSAGIVLCIRDMMYRTIRMLKSHRSIPAGFARYDAHPSTYSIALIASLSQWARANPSAKLTQNPGWPGCCRPPSAGEQKAVAIADWPSVSTIYHIPIPLDVKAILDTLNFQRMHTFANNSTNARAPASPSQPPSMSRRGSAAVASALRNEVTPVKTTSLPIPAKLRGSSPLQSTATLTNPASRASAELSPSSAISSNGMDQIVLPRRPMVDVQPEKRRDNSREAKQSPGRKNAELTGTLSRKGGAQRPPLSNVISPAKATGDAQPQPRKGSSGNPSPPPSNTLRNADRTHEKSNSPSTLRQRSPLDLDVSGLSISSGSSSASSDSGDGSETTVISDGGFTDYLSDESEAELQRQAEIRAAIVAQTQVEEQEFRAARQQLANIDLRPPRSWTSNVNSMPRSQSGAPADNGSYGSQQFSSSSFTGQATTQSRV
ncbi:hypothetical protein BC835DRAFT_1415811 [Cytidiella melzeri]|nr:hypothetical protein BC835DRAFT_1415811 [Cytidiella melzeri]